MLDKDLEISEKSREKKFRYANNLCDTDDDGGIMSQCSK